MKKMLLILLLIPFFTQGQTTVTICDGDSALIYGNWQTNSATYTNSNGNTTTLVVNPLPIICLLYTSPSPRDRTRSRMPSSA